jgi:hypothetical protein
MYFVTPGEKERATVDASPYIFFIMLIFGFGILYLTRKRPKPPEKPRYMVIDTQPGKDS